MSRFNRKGWKTVRGKKPDGTVAPFPVKIGGYHDRANKKAVAKFKKERQQAFREYKKSLKEAKKHVPLAERSKLRLTHMPERYLDGEQQ